MQQYLGMGKDFDGTSKIPLLCEVCTILPVRLLKNQSVVSACRCESRGAQVHSFEYEHKTDSNQLQRVSFATLQVSESQAQRGE